MAKEEGGIRFLLCRPWEKKTPKGLDIFEFGDHRYMVVSIHKSLAEALEFSNYISALIAKVLFSQAEKIDAQTPHEFLNWENPEQKIAQPQD
ncbi:MAG: hypothetical protein NTX82_00355 [Candidatus Parcubacteria bacterium]|nr:hypothetical protein [Candidatus Parcubacteria bacterium]